MRYADMLQGILTYIDEHLHEKLDADTLASKAGFSTYHFCRVFRFGVGYSVMEYVRQRRLLYAAAELSTGKKMIDIAMDYGFETHSGFSKAFRRHFGCPPETYAMHAQAKKPALPKLVHMEKYALGGIVMEPKFVTKPAIKLVGYAITTTSNGNENNTAIPAFWTALLSDRRVKKLHGESFVKNHAEYGACFPENPESGEFVYLIGVEPVEGAAIPPTYTACELPAATYAVFSSPPSTDVEFSASIQGTWRYILNEWFPDSGYEYAEGCVDFEYYDEHNMGDAGNVCDIYVPVSPKK